MNPSTASGRLTKDILFSFVLRDNIKCYRCGEELTRDTFSIEHKVPWLDSKDPVGLFFNLDNISYSHLLCNTGAARKTNKLYHTDDERAEAQVIYTKRATSKRVYSSSSRREKYLRKGT